ncbi:MULTISPECIES: hypothetical protein [unclassified Nocardiopsis]|uniref:hypothetical protein n=1 Tax=unclassified Nocardiopsis TaxID=2649073 RepID=UPI001359DC86|nr:MULTISPECIES: hypothetical protein [unclassified Nocardiopsis]
MIPNIIALVGVVLLGLAAGFFLAVCIGIRRQDDRGTYRSLRGGQGSTPLSRTGSLVVGLRFPGKGAGSRDRTPTAV